MAIYYPWTGPQCNVNLNGVSTISQIQDIHIKKGLSYLQVRFIVLALAGPSSAVNCGSGWRHKNVGLWLYTPNTAGDYQHMGQSGLTSDAVIFLLICVLADWRR